MSSEHFKLVTMITYNYLQCRDTFWVESFNHQLLTYLPKRIHFGSSTFDMRMNLAILDWVCCTTHCIQIEYLFTLQNENVCRESTSERLVQDMRRPDRRTAMKVLVKKSFKTIYGRVTFSKDPTSSGIVAMVSFYPFTLLIQ